MRGTLLDETDVIRVSDALVESNLRLEESSQSLSDLLGLVGHDLRNPLSVSMGFLSMTGLELDDLEQAGADVSTARAMLTRASDAAQRVEAMLASVLEMSRIDYGTLRSHGELLDVAETVRQAVADLTISSEVQLADAGQGVPEDFVPRLFDRFSRAGGDTRPGTGLGLHLARRLCRVMGGDLTYLPPADGQGPRFVVSLASG